MSSVRPEAEPVVRVACALLRLRGRQNRQDDPCRSAVLREDHAAATSRMQGLPGGHRECPSPNTSAPRIRQNSDAHHRYVEAIKQTDPINVCHSRRQCLFERCSIEIFAVRLRGVWPTSSRQPRAARFGASTTGQVIGQHQRRHRHQEFLRFFRKIDKNTPAELDLHCPQVNRVISDSEH